MSASIAYQTTHGTFPVQVEEDQTVLDALTRSSIPWTSVMSFARTGKSAKWIAFPCLDKTGRDLEGDQEIILVSKRNVLPPLESFHQIESRTVAPNQAVSEYIFPSPENPYAYVHAQLSSSECRDLVRTNVRAVLQGRASVPTKVVVGISGGGDSNALLDALVANADLNFDILPLMILGVPEWDLGRARAEELCRGYGLKLEVWEEPRLRAELGMAAPEGASLTSAFETVFPGDDFEFLGTLLIRLALAKYATDSRAEYLCTGANLEDCLADLFYCVSRGKSILSRPALPLEEKTLLTPLWLTPKKIIDGCFPAYSFENYESRVPCSSKGRSHFYNMALGFTSQYPGMGESLLRSLSPLPSTENQHSQRDDALGFSVFERVPEDLRQRMLKLWRGDANPS